MKLGQKVDKKADLNEIESDCLWHFHRTTQSLIAERIHLSTLAIDFSKAIPYPILVKNILAILNNQAWGIFSKNFEFYFRFISYNNLKFNEINISNKSQSFERKFAACFYDDSIFTFEVQINDNPWIADRRARRYLISQNRWISLSAIYFGHCPESCSGINQKIVIVGAWNEFWIYDINLDSYFKIFPIGFPRESEVRIIVKAEGKMNLMIYSQITEVYCCYDPLCEWNLVCKLDKQGPLNKLENHFSSSVLYEGFVYCIRDSEIFQFNLNTFEWKRVSKLIE